jgi:hypothetical protein
MINIQRYTQLRADVTTMLGPDISLFKQTMMDVNGTYRGYLVPDLT